MEKLIFWVVYGIGFIVGYYFHRWAFTKYMALSGYETGWERVFFAAFVAIFSWLGVIITLALSLVFGLFTNKYSKPPKWL